MASGPGSTGEEQPPALPVKQRRLNSVDFDCMMLSPVGLQLDNYACDDVFPEATDCHAAQCPIHQRYDPGTRHQMRFFSDGTPPPIPKKRLARALSLQGINAPQLSPLSPVQRHPQNFDNPLYMLAPVPETYFHQEPGEFQPVGGGPVPLLSFDTPDEHLSHLFGGFDDQRVVSRGIRHRHLLFLRSTAQSVEAGILLQKGEATERDAASHRPQDFLLSEGSEPKQIGDAVYYSLHSPKLPGRMLGLRVHKQPDGASSARSEHQPPPAHVNVREAIAHFQGSGTLGCDSMLLQTQGPSRRLKSDCAATAAKPRGGGRNECAGINLTSVQSFLQKGLSVSVERDRPRATLEDFVQDSGSSRSADRLDYDRRVCALLLQILTGSQHLYDVSATAAELRPRGIFLVWPEGENQLEAKRGHRTSRRKEDMEWGRKKGKIQMSWRTHGSPRVVLTPLPSVPHPLTYIQSQVGALIQYCLHSQESPTPLDSGPNLFMSSHRMGLLYLASRLQSETSGPQMADMVAVLQVLLWGPRVPLFNHRGSMTTAVHNWLTVKRALLVMKLAERGLIQDQSALDWEDCMCLQYLSFTDPEAVVSTTSQLWLTLNTERPC
ncbi:inactive tyrosine-protein kinase PEAK1 [Cyclopterus lumpus]|uniref:inactive tyrosine-protein kinase PEAK1 n=1 Tax=Cyclopterus lumpus TaxID=8103 RepID=UPI001485CAAA|nr:inactive tyrosine-protein kinase PEAK1 [Cyclopterus lumpus]